MSRTARRSSGWSTTDARVERIRAGEGLREALRVRIGAIRAVGSIAVYINLD
jgi:hypothetical protein